jgi:hypothetical protein
MSQKIFINYRRTGSSSNFAALLYAHLQTTYSQDQIFKDFRDIQPGDDFVAKIEDALEHCKVLLVLIGPAWAAANERGRARLFEPQDFVCMEIAKMLERKEVRLLPVLFDGAVMPLARELPLEIQALCGRQAIEIRTEKFESDLLPLIKAIDAALGVKRHDERPEKGHATADVVPEKKRSSGMIAVIIFVVFLIAAAIVIDSNSKFL